ncbi:molybdenum cofactor guanylyltransferase [Chromobacterium sphagni]|uniref:Molybdenum cofactor guanylyltransferase n=1 Tax=Chromobacterium sphagni TaxID=1903179 RepID=A0A1S1X4N1_9NEIS|nr:molybdenum cofactor guanylyltransferase MobA [Chromobacterium sphagni]OHX14441.1 molybdenum cofactor guanylyltransferase [Chromobacterium sphagni]
MKQCIDTSQISGLILAGGQGSRMAGQDKGWLELAGLPLIVRVRARLQPQVGELLISANRNLPRYAAFGRTVPDAAEFAGCGPLAGLEAGLSVCATDWLVVAPCDLPFLPDDLAARLLAPLLRGEAKLSAAGCAGRQHPACMALSVELLADLRAYLRAGGRKVREWQAGVGALEVGFHDAPEAFHNLNTPDELAAAVAYASQWRQS